MEQYIPKSVVLAEIKKLIDEIYAERPFDALSSGQQTALWYIKSIMSSIDTLEAKEVDVDKEINEHAWYMPQSEFSHDSEVLENIEWAKNEFRYFFELGMSVSKK